MDYSTQVKNTQFTSDINFFLSRPKIGIQESRLGYGESHLPLIYLLCVLNGSLGLRKLCLHNNKYSFLFMALISYPVSYLASKHVFGNDKYRTVAKRDEDTRNSVKYYVENADLKN